MMRWVTHLGGAPVTVGTGLLLLAAGAWHGDLRIGGATLLALTLSHVTVQVLKRAVARPRPCDAGGQPLALIELPDPFSFPSGHAAAATAIASSVGLQHPPLAAPLLLVAAVVAASRVSLRVHHVSDVLAGSALGLGGTVAAALLV